MGLDRKRGSESQGTCYRTVILQNPSASSLLYNFQCQCHKISLVSRWGKFKIWNTNSQHVDEFSKPGWPHSAQLLFHFLCNQFPAGKSRCFHFKVGIRKSKHVKVFWTLTQKHHVRVQEEHVLPCEWVSPTGRYFCLYLWSFPEQKSGRVWDGDSLIVDMQVHCHKCNWAQLVQRAGSPCSQAAPRTAKHINANFVYTLQQVTILESKLCVCVFQLLVFFWFPCGHWYKPPDILLVKLFWMCEFKNGSPGSPEAEPSSKYFIKYRWFVFFIFVG